jgi:hypothetical protein
MVKIDARFWGSYPSASFNDGEGGRAGAGAIWLQIEKKFAAESKP